MVPKVVADAMEWEKPWESAEEFERREKVVRPLEDRA